MDPCAGYRFAPDNEEIINRFLEGKMRDNYSFPLIKEVDFNQYDPWDLPELSPLPADNGKWYFFTSPSYIDQNRKISRRTNNGYWKVTGRDRHIVDRRTKEVIGSIKTMVFYSGHVAKANIRTEWVMHEFRSSKAHSYQKEFLLCRISFKGRHDTSSNLASRPESHLFLQAAMGWMFAIINVALEVPSAVFDQLSSANKPGYARYAMLLSYIAMVFSVVELVWKGHKAKVFWMSGKFWFYYPYGNSIQPYFGSFKDNVGPFCALCQCIITAVNYTHTSKPIQVLVWPIIYSFCLLSSQIVGTLRRDANLPRLNV